LGVGSKFNSSTTFKYFKGRGGQLFCLGGHKERAPFCRGPYLRKEQVSVQGSLSINVCWDKLEEMSDLRSFPECFVTNCPPLPWGIYQGFNELSFVDHSLPTTNAIWPIRSSKDAYFHLVYLKKTTSKLPLLSGPDDVIQKFLDLPVVRSPPGPKKVQAHTMFIGLLAAACKVFFISSSYRMV